MCIKRGEGDLERFYVLKKSSVSFLKCILFAYACDVSVHRYVTLLTKYLDCQDVGQCTGLDPHDHRHPSQEDYIFYYDIT